MRRHPPSPALRAPLVIAAALGGAVARLFFVKLRPSGEPARAGSGGGERVELPAPRREGEMSLEEALDSRRSRREFAAGALSEEERAQLLWAAQGLRSDERGRTAPSAGALYPLEVYWVDADGVFHYLVEEHALERLAEGDRRRNLAAAALGQKSVAGAPAIIIITGVVARTAEKYTERAERYVWLEAGHAAQNVLLQATALGLAAVPVGAFGDGRVRAALNLPAGCAPLYIIPVGRAAEE